MSIIESVIEQTLTMCQKLLPSSIGREEQSPNLILMADFILTVGPDSRTSIYFMVILFWSVHSLEVFATALSKCWKHKWGAEADAIAFVLSPIPPSEVLLCIRAL